MEEKNLFFPVFISLQGKKCVVVGGGTIATRRVQTLIEFCEDIVVIAPEVSKELTSLIAEGRVQHKNRIYKTGDCQGADLVIAATNMRQVNYQVGKEGKSLKAYVSVADAMEEGNFLFPGIAKDHDTGAVIGVCSSGRNHSLAKKLSAACKGLVKNSQFMEKL